MGWINRRRFLKASLGAAAALIGCGEKSEENPPIYPPDQEGEEKKEEGGQPEEERPSTRPKVGISRCYTYERAAVEDAVASAIEASGGLKDIIKPGDTVLIKPNYTGGGTGGVGGVSSVESYTTHPEVLRAVGKMVLEAGAKAIIISEGWGPSAFRECGGDRVAADLGATILDSDRPEPGLDFLTVPIGPRKHIVDFIYLNEVVANAKVLISVAKLKCHATAGITLSIKNIFGFLPVGKYGGNVRSLAHGDNGYYRIPRFLVDILMVRPIHFAVIDGISTIQGGEGPWNRGVSLIRPGVIIAGRNPVAVDAVGTAVMGFDPSAGKGEEPFSLCDNHLAMAAAAGLGPNKLEDIDVRGEPISNVRIKFKPAMAPPSYLYRVRCSP